VTHNAALGQRDGVPKEKFAALADYTTNPLFSDLERLVIRYAEEMTEKVQVGSRLVEELKKQLGPEALVAAHAQHRGRQLHQPLQRGARHGSGDLKQRSMASSTSSSWRTSFTEKQRRSHV